MSITKQATTGVPTGTWHADTVHSRVAFEVPYAVATFSGEVTDFEATLSDGKLSGNARISSITVKDENLEVSVAELLGNLERSSQLQARLADLAPGALSRPLLSRADENADES